MEYLDKLGVKYEVKDIESDAHSPKKLSKSQVKWVYQSLISKVISLLALIAPELMLLSKLTTS